MKEEKKILKVIKDNFTLWIEPNYKATLCFQQHSTMTPSEYELLVKFFGEPKEN